MDDWKITRDRKGCERPGCPLPSAQQYFAVLEFPQCVRRDVCDACFCDLERKNEGPLVFWRGIRRSKGNKEPVLDLVSLRALFDKLAEVDDDRARSLRYFCALLLLRKRALRMVKPRTQEQERADLVVVDPKQKDAEPVALFAPAIELDDLSKIKEELLAAMGEDDGQQAAQAADAVPEKAGAAQVQASGGAPSEEAPNEGIPGEGIPGEGTPGEGAAGEGIPGEGIPGEGAAGEGVSGEGHPIAGSAGSVAPVEADAAAGTTAAAAIQEPSSAAGSTAAS